ncbi:MAG TPA: glycosyl hydrolase [Phycisphaerae bacterium]|nr:glycosyl hydrolase [Phycisphaerae bacterium]
MKRVAAGVGVLLACAIGTARGDDLIRQELTMPTAAELTANVKEPPAEYSLSLYWGWEGKITPELLDRELDMIKSRGFRCVTIEPGYFLDPPYLSPGWFDTMKMGVELAKKKGMHVYIVDEGKYPSGFAGGKFSQERPDLRMQGMNARRIPVAAGQEISQPAANLIYAVATDAAAGKSVEIPITGDTLKWTAPAEGTWELTLIYHDFHTSPTKSVNNPVVNAKDTSASLEDYMSDAATQQYIDWTHEGYKKVLGDEFGHTVLGFRGDEPDYSINPWMPYTPKLLDEFQAKKGYDLRPYLPSMFPTGGRGAMINTASDVTEEQKRARADYFDVWSDMFRDHWFSKLADWCKDNHVQYEVHINHEENLPLMARSEGDYFKCYRDVGIPGIDTIWHQIWPGLVSDFPKLASSAAHLTGRPRAFTESFAAYNPKPNMAQARWILNEEMVRGVNNVEIMFYGTEGARPANAPSPNAPPPAPAAGRGRGRGPGGVAARGPGTRRGNPGQANTTSAPGPGGVLGQVDPNPPARMIADPEFPALAAYVNRATYLLSQGHPTARIALYVPFSSMWLSSADGQTANASYKAAMQALMEHQLDFDLFDDQSVDADLTLKGKTLVNKSGSAYDTVLVPTVSALSKRTLDLLRKFHDAGGTVVFLGDLPRMIPDKTFLNAPAPGDLSWATREPIADFVAAPRESDVHLMAATPAVKYLHRHYQDAEGYFFFNEGDDPVQVGVELACNGHGQQIDLTTGQAAPVEGEIKHLGDATFTLKLAPYQTTFFLVHP